MKKISLAMSRGFSSANTKCQTVICKPSKGAANMKKMIWHEKAVIVFSGGVDSICAVSFLKSKYELYGITFSYGQKGKQ